MARSSIFKSRPESRLTPVPRSCGSRAFTTLVLSCAMKKAGSLCVPPASIAPEAHFLRNSRRFGSSLCLIRVPEGPACEPGTSIEVLPLCVAGGKANAKKNGQKAANSIAPAYSSASRGGAGDLTRSAISEGELQCQLYLARPGREIWPDQFRSGLAEPRTVRGKDVTWLIELHAVEKIVELET